MTMNYDKLIAFAAGELAGDDLRAVEQQIATDPAAARTVALFRAVRSTLRDDDSVAPPDAVVARARALFRPAPSAVAAWWEALKRVVAELTYDSRPALALAGLRGAGDARQLSYHAEIADVDLQIDAAGELARVTGQVSAAAPAEAHEVALVPQSGGEPVQARVEPDGSFVLSAPRGAYDLVVRFADDALVMSGLPMA